MRTVTIFGSNGNSVSVEDSGDQGGVSILAIAGTLTRAEVEELISYLTNHLRETRDNAAAAAKTPNPYPEWRKAFGDIEQ